MLVRHIMTSAPTVVTRDETMMDAARKMSSGDVGMLPVVQGREHPKLLGVITDRDIVVRHVALSHGYSCAVGAHMTSEGIEVAHPDEEVEVAITKMKRAKVRRLPVVDGEDHVVGVLAQAAIARDVGPVDPEGVEELLEEVSEPTHLPTA